MVLRYRIIASVFAGDRRCGASVSAWLNAMAPKTIGSVDNQP
jgi:hypothetical protein